MRNNFFYILIICAFTEILTKNEEKKSTGKEAIKHTRKFYEEEARKDIQNLLSSVKKHNFSEEYEDDNHLLSADVPRSNKIMERIDEILKNKKTKKAKQKKKNLRSNAPMIEYFKRGAHVQNSALNLRNPIKSSSNMRNFDANNNHFLQLMNTLMIPNSGFVKSRISGGHSVNNLLRNKVNLVDIKPEVYPVFIANNNNKYGIREISSEEDLQNSAPYYTNDEDKLIELPNKVDTEYKNQSTIRTATIPMTENFDLEELLNQLHIKRGEIISTRKESDNNVRLHDFFNKFYSQSASHLRPGNRVENAHNHLDELEDNIDSKDRDNSKTIFLRSDVIDNVHPNTNERLDEFMNYLDIGKNLRTSHNTLSYGNNPQPVFQRIVRQGDRRGRQRRSTNTQAGYTQDPDTCKTYNENLVKLWSNLSKLINVTEQPNERALHNIAMMIQAYLEHQNAKPPPESHKAKHEGPRDKISEVMLKIRKLLEETEGSAEKITKVITNYLKPDYTDAETEDCQQVNEEFLSSSVDLLYKNYLENSDCEGEDDSVARNKKLSLRERKVKSAKFSNGHMTLETNDHNPEFQTVLIENEFYNDFQKGKVPRQRPTNKYRRVYKPSKNKRSHPAYRSGNQNESKKLQTRSKASSKSSSNKQKKSSRKSDFVKSKCEKYLTRKLIISLRPVMERFIGRLECELDNTLRSVSFGKDSENPYYVYASKFYSNDGSRRHRKISPKLQAKNTGRKRNKSPKKLYTKRHDSTFEHDQDVHERDDETDSARVRKYSFDQNKGMNSGSYAVARDTDIRESDTKNNKKNDNSDYLMTYDEYFQSPPLYDEYDGIYKTHQLTNSNGFISLINPAISLNDKKDNRFKPIKQKLASSDKEKDKNDEYAFVQERFSEESNHAINFDQQTESNNKEQPFIDLTKLRNDDQLIEEKSKVHVKTFESIAEFLKRARDASLQTPEFAVPFALDTNKGYVELTHLIKYPKMLVYRPQFLVKNTMPYDDFLKTINNSNMTNDDVQLLKIIRHLPDSSVKVLFETEDFEAPLEVRYLNDDRRSGSPDPVVNHQSESRVEMGNENTNSDLTNRDSEDLIISSQIEAHRKDVDALDKLESVGSDEDLSPDFNTYLETLELKEEQSPIMYLDYNPDTNLTLNSKPNSSESSSSSWFSPLPNFSSGLFPKNPSSDTGQDVDQGSAVGSAAGSQIGSGIKLGLDKALNLGFKLNPIHSSPLGSFVNKLLSSHSNTQSTSNPSLNSQSHINSYTDSSAESISASNSYSHSGSWSNSNSGSHSLLPNTDSNNMEVGNNFSSSTKSIILPWWRKWKNLVKGKIKQIIGKMASLTDNLDQIIRQ